MHEKRWRFLDTGKGSAVFNMAFDRAIMHLVDSGYYSPVFRVYGWQPAAITIGYSQSAENILDIDRCLADGIDIVKRPTGGRAVYHDDEIAYAVVARRDDPHFGGSIMETYSLISQMLSDALNAMGVGTAFGRGNIDTEGRYFRKGQPCFISSSRYEITCNGRKIIGSAQLRKGNVFLQHGSILAGSGQERIAEYMKDRSRAFQLAESLKKKSTNMKAVLGNSFSEDCLKASILDSLRDSIDTEAVCSEPSAEELELTEHYARQEEASCI